MQKKAKPAPDKDKKTYAEARRRRPRTDSRDPGASVSPAKGESSATSHKPVARSASGFAGARGSLPVPSSSGFKVVSRFGPHPLPDLPTVVYDNPGVDAEVAPGASALAVYPGTVSGIYVLKGFSTVIIVNHGGYYTVYGNLASTAVKKGDNVRQGQPLGRVAADASASDRPLLHFEVWRGRDKLNPMDWLR